MNRYGLFMSVLSVAKLYYPLSLQEKSQYSEIVIQFINNKFPTASLCKDKFDLENNYSLIFYNDEVSQKNNHEATEFLKAQLVGHIIIKIPDDKQLIPTLAFKIKGEELVRFVNAIKILTPNLDEDARATLTV